MGLLDVLNGMQNGPRGSSDPKSGGMSPLTMAMLALLAYKAVTKMTAGSSGAAPAGAPTPTQSGGGLGGALGGALGGGGGLGGMLGGLLAGGAAGSVLTGGLGDLMKQLQNNGHSETASSWVSSGPNKSISPNDLASALGADQINSLMSQSGLSRDDLLQGLSQHLPEVVNHLTPDGRLPTEQEVSRMV